jgi:hypothetical protein
MGFAIARLGTARHVISSREGGCAHGPAESGYVGFQTAFGPSCVHREHREDVVTMLLGTKSGLRPSMRSQLTEEWRAA